MQAHDFYLLNPAGNITLFLLSQQVNPEERETICARAMAEIPAEQAGCVNIETESLTMAGNEFCVNATRAFGALLDWKSPSSKNSPRHYKVSVSGWPHKIILEAQGECPVWEIAATLDIPDVHIIRENKTIIMELPGITHVLIKSPVFPTREEAFEQAHALRLQYNLSCYAASGITWWRETENKLEILPVVHVSGPGTTFLEQSCGSASLALYLAAFQDASSTDILQPSGESLRIEKRGNSVCVSGSVSLVADGRLWL